MANPYHHALSSVQKWGGEVDDYLPIHQWFDASKEFFGDFRHRMLRHHAQGIFECERQFGVVTTISSGRKIPTRWIGEQHVMEDMGRIPSLTEWLACVNPQPWMNKSRKLSRELEETPKEKEELTPRPWPGVSEWHEQVDKALSDLCLSVRAMKALWSIRICTLKNLLEISTQKLYDTPGLGMTTLNEIREKVEARGLCLNESVGWLNCSLYTENKLEECGIKTINDLRNYPNLYATIGKVAYKELVDRSTAHPWLRGITLEEQSEQATSANAGEEV